MKLLGKNFIAGSAGRATSMATVAAHGTSDVGFSDTAGGLLPAASAILSPQLAVLAAHLKQACWHSVAYAQVELESQGPEVEHMLDSSGGSLPHACCQSQVSFVVLE